MIYTKEENRTWWNRLSKQDQSEIFDRIIENAQSPYFINWAEEAIQIWERNSPLSDSDLIVLRKWA